MSACCSHGDESYSKNLTRRFWFSLLFGFPVIFLSMGPMVFGTSAWKKFGLFFQEPYSAWLQGLFALIVVFWCGWPIWQKGVKSFRSGHLNMFSLVCLGTGITVAYSIGILFFPQLLLHGENDLYFETATMIVILILLGQLLEVRGSRKANSALQQLLELAPNSATLVSDGKEMLVSVGTLKPGDLVRLHPGEKIAVDGIVIEGSSAVDESMLTGEAIPVEKNAGARATAGTLNVQGSFVMRVEKTGRDTMLAQIIATVAAAQRSRAPIQQLADRVAAVFVPVVLGIAVVTFFAWMIVSPQLGIAFALARAIAVLMISCPCALGLATPMAITVGVGTAARHGILVREARALQQLASASIMALDKTGTLTEGRPKVVAIKTLDEMGEKFFLALLAAAERGSEHPLAQAVIRYAEQQQVIKKTASDFFAEPGGGISAKVDGINILAGSEKFLLSHGVDFLENQEEAIFQQSLVMVAFDGKFSGIIFVSDPIKASAASFLKALRELEIKPVMLTGDRKSVAKRIAEQLGIEEWKAALSPTQKAEAILKWKKNGAIVAMAGDGINDAQALSVADAGIAMHAGTNIAKETAGIVLMNTSLTTIVEAVQISRSLLQIIRQNLFFAFAYNLLAIPIATGIFYPVFGMTLSPMVATAAMSLSSLSVIGNSLTLNFRLNLKT